MKRIGEKLFSMLLCLCMAISLLPTAAFAMENDQDNVPVCAELEGCTEDTHAEGCPLYAAPTADPKTPTNIDPTITVAALIAALPDAGDITVDNADDVAAQLDAINHAKEALTEQQRNALDFSKYDAASDALMALSGQLGAGAPMPMALTVSIDTDFLPAAQVGVPYSATLVGTGTAPLKWAVRKSSGLPKGLTLGADGTIFGMPTVSGTFQIDFRVTDGDNDSANKYLTLMIDPKVSQAIVPGTEDITDWSHVYYGGLNGEPLYWRVLDADQGSDSAATSMFLLSEYVLDTIYYNQYNNTYVWDGSDAKRWCDEFAASPNFTTHELANMIELPSYGKLFFLTNTQAENGEYFRIEGTMPANPDSRKAFLLDGNTASSWWLCSNSFSTSLPVHSVYANGGIMRGIANNQNGARPAMNIDRQSILFSADAANGGHNAVFSVPAAYSGTDWKLTLKDNNNFATGASKTNGSTTLAAGYDAETLTFSHRALSTISADYTNVTAALTNADGDILYYGSINSNTAATVSSVTIPQGLVVGSYTLSLYGEDWNDVNATDYATGTPFTQTITVVAPTSYNTPAEITQNGVTAAVTYSCASPQMESTNVTATVTLTGTATTAGTHTVNLSSTKANLTGIEQNINVTAGQNSFTVPDTYSFTVPAEDVDDLTLTHTYTPMPQTVAAPVFSPAGGTYTSAQSVTLSCSTAGAVIRYTTDGSEPTSSSTEYTGAITVSSTTPIKAKAFATGMTDSSTTSVSFTITKADQSVSYGTNTVTKHVNDAAFTHMLTQTTVDGVISYASSNTDVATVNEATGEVTIVGVGTTTITATAAETANYHSGSAEYTLTVSDHSYADVVTPPTCTAQGYTTYTCSACGDRYTDTYTDAFGHTYGDTWKSNADSHWHECTVCGEKSDTAAHVFGDWTVTKKATATEAGSRERTCAICGYRVSETIAATRTNNTNTPQTGDSSNLTLWIALLLLASGGITGILLYSKKRRMTK